jgi:ketosteroid isomerase-like protein
MQTQNERQAAEGLLRAYAEALNSATTALIPSFYTQDGLFLPQGSKALTFTDLPQRSVSFFKKVRFYIDYSLKDIAVDKGYAFVEATAKTRTTDLATNQELTQTSRDFFVLRKEQEEWKIYRYIFNHVKEQ